MDKILKHGQLGTYTNHKCRCDECRAVNTEYWRNYRLNNKVSKYNPDRRKDNRKNKRKYIQDFKSSKGCMDCGYNVDPVALDFDHRTSSNKTFTISQMTNRTWTQLDEEIAKCDVVCANCHRLRTKNRWYNE